VREGLYTVVPGAGSCRDTEGTVGEASETRKANCMCYPPRYQLYGHWKNDTYEKHPDLMEARTQTISRGRYIMK